MTAEPVGVPTATTGRFLVMAAASLGSSSFVYRLVLAKSSFSPALAVLVGPAALLVMTVLIYFVRPAWQRRGAKDPDAVRNEDEPLMAARVADIADELGLPECPRVMISDKTTAYAFGRYRSYTVVLGQLPTGAFSAQRDLLLFDGLVRHELHHIRNRDADTAGLAISMAVAFGLVVMAPHAVLVGAEDIGSYLRADVWRLLAFAAVVLGMLAGVQQARELHADVGSGIPEDALSGLEARRLRLFHPRPKTRLDALKGTYQIDRISPWLGAVTGVAAGLAARPVGDAVELLAGESASVAVQAFPGGVVIGLVIAAVIGPAMWRAASHGTGGQWWFWLEGLTIGAGVLVGTELTLEQPLLLEALFGDRLLVVEIGAVAMLAALQALLCRWLAATAPAWLDGTRFRSRGHLVGAVLTVLVPTIALWTYFSWIHRMLSGSPIFYDSVQVVLLGHGAPSDPGLLDQLTLFLVALYDALFVESAALSPAGIGGVLCLLVPLALGHLRGGALWWCVAQVAAGGSVVFLLSLPFLARLLADVISKADNDGRLSGTAWPTLALWDLPLAVLGIAVGAVVAARAARADLRWPTLGGMSGAVLCGLVTFSASVVYWWPMPVAFFGMTATAALIAAPLLCLPVAVFLGRPSGRIRTEAVTEDQEGARPRIRRRTTAAIGTVSVLMVVGSFHLAPRLVRVTPPLSEDQKTTRCVTGQWAAEMVSDTVRIAGEKGVVSGGEGITWAFGTDGHYVRNTHSAGFDVLWRSKGLRMVYEGVTEGDWRVQDGELLLNITRTDEVRTLYITPDRPLDDRVRLRTTVEPAHFSVLCGSPVMRLGLGDATEMLFKATS
ncbi:hypothetical protein ACWEQL_29305 [Kitasatospora sp. NPDC004240]